MEQWASIAIVLATFLFAGTVKGVVGLGLPTVSLAILSATIGLRDAMAAMVIPSLVTNMAQAASGGMLATVVRRFWPMCVAMAVGVWAGMAVGVGIDAAVLTAILGGMLCAYALAGLLTRPFPELARFEPWAAPLTGLLSGIAAGLVGVLMVPGIMYLQAMGLKKKELIAAMGLLFSVATAVLIMALARHQFLDGAKAAVSAAAVIPALVGMALGTRLRSRLSEARFRTVFLCALFALGIYILVR